MVPSKFPVTDMLMNVMLQMAALAESRQVGPFVIRTISVQVSGAKYHPGQAVKLQRFQVMLSGSSQAAVRSARTRYGASAHAPPGNRWILFPFGAEHHSHFQPASVRTWREMASQLGS